MKLADIAVKPRIIGVMATPLLLMLVIGVVSVRSLDSIEAKQDQALHTASVLSMADAIVAAAVDMETGMRGYVLTRSETFLKPYARGAGVIDALKADLIATLSDDPEQVARLKAAAETLAAWGAKVAEPLIALRRDGAPMFDILQQVSRGEGQVYFDAYRSEMAAFSAAERQVMGQRLEESHATHDHAVLFIVIVIALAIMVSAVIGWIVGNGVARPVGQITRVMGALADGDKSVAIPGIDRKDEIGAMAAAVLVFKENMIRADALAAKEAADAATRQNRSKKLEALTTGFDANVTALLGTVTGAASEMDGTARSMSSVAEGTSRRAADVAAASEQASTNVQTVATATEELSCSIQEIGRRIAQSTEIAGLAVVEAEKTDGQVRSLEASANRIGDVVKLISDIAEQTNLLALNATIEAARAGDAGKGFAVVAAEVKSLATQTATATEDIAKQVDSIQQETRAAVGAIQSIGGVIGEINEISTGIAAAIEEQGAATEEIARNVQQAAVGSDTVNRNIVDVTSAASETGAAAQQASALAASLNAQAETLKAEVDDFLCGVRAA